MASSFSATAGAAAEAIAAQAPAWVTIPTAVLTAVVVLLISELCRPARPAPGPSGRESRRGSLFRRVVRMKQAIEKSATAQDSTDREARMAHVERRYFNPSRQTLDQARAAGAAAIWRKTAPLAEGAEARRAWFIGAATSFEPIKVHNRLWVSYRRWVDERVALCEGKTEVFHNFVIAHSLSIPTPPKMIWTGARANASDRRRAACRPPTATRRAVLLPIRRRRCVCKAHARARAGTDAGDLVSCMAVAGVLGTDVDGHGARRPSVTVAPRPGGVAYGRRTAQHASLPPDPFEHTPIIPWRGAPHGLTLSI